VTPEFAPVFYFGDDRSRAEFKAWQIGLRNAKIVFTNGVFDILHAGHVSYIRDARALGDALVLGLNSDASVRSIKGPKRPLLHEADRAKLIAALRFVDAVILFDQETPLDLITFIQPDVMVKGGDYTRDTIVGADVVESRGGRVVTIPLTEGRSTTGIVERIIERYAK
jgi:D-beta-D-heptose 7-phosphate kinase / D-beta-D-heptose 1-phosphate adenosyltransferase